ncbi:MAG: hypothetical protein MUO54_12780 [Anaerolineales bacterium]|nr:hypothetical protein [Anaerolineales bacterium]
MGNKLTNSLIGNFLYVFLSVITKTCKFEISGLDRLQIVLESGNPIIGTSWHGMTMMVVGSMCNYVDIKSFVTIVPDDYRGDILEIFANKIGIYPTKVNLAGDTSLSLSRKMIGIIREITSGRNFLIHPDGPAGPAYVVKPGLTAIAQKTGATIVPFGCYCRNAYIRHRWDRYTFPYPYSKVHVHIGEPFTIPKSLSDLTETNHQLEDILNRVSAQAAANYYEQ